MSDFKPEWTGAEALTYTIETGQDLTDPLCSLRQWEADRELEKDRREFESGNNRILFTAIARCARHRLPMPGWLANVYLERLQPWYDLEAKTLDEAFGAEWIKGKNRNAETTYRKHCKAVFLEVYRLHKDENEGISMSIFDLAAKNLSFGKSDASVRNMYYRYLSENPSAKMAMDDVKLRKNARSKSYKNIKNTV